MYFGNSSLYNDNDLSLNEGVLGAIALTIGAIIFLPFAMIISLTLILVAISKAQSKKQEKQTKTVKEKINSNPELKSSYDKLIKELQKDLSYVLKPYKKYISFDTNNFKVYGQDGQLIVFKKFCSIDGDKLFKDIYKIDFFTYNKDYKKDNKCKPAPAYVKECKIIKKNICNLNKTINKITKSKAIEFDYTTYGEYDKEFNLYYCGTITDEFDISLRININKINNIKLPNYKN